MSLPYSSSNPALSPEKNRMFSSRKSDKDIAGARHKTIGHHDPRGI